MTDALATPQVDDNPLIHLGANNPPEPTPFEAISTHIEDLYSEALNWADGQPIESEIQAQKVSDLMRYLEEAHKAADAQRKIENEPFDLGKAEVQARYAPLIADTKGTTGKTVRAVAALKALLKPYLVAQEQERLRAAEEARQEAKRLADEARAAAQAATDLREAEQAERLFRESKVAARDAVRIEDDRARVGGYERAAQVSYKWVAVLRSPAEAVRHYWSVRREEFEALALKLAQEEVRSGKRQIPGFAVIQEPVVK